MARAMLKAGLGAAHRAALHARLRPQLARHLVRAGADRRDARRRRALDHRAQRRHGAAGSGAASPSCSTRAPARPPRRLGTFLIAAMYQGSAVACAMFLTGQASNVLGAGLALKLADVESPGPAGSSRRACRGSSLPGRAVGRLPAADRPRFAHAGSRGVRAQRAGAHGAADARRRGSRSRVFAGVGRCGSRPAGIGLDVTFVALLGLCVLLVTGTLTWAGVRRGSARLGRVHLVRRPADAWASC